MTVDFNNDMTGAIDTISQQITSSNLTGVAESVVGLPTRELVDICERLNVKQRAVVFRLLPKQQALEVFETLAPPLQSDLVSALRDSEVASLFAGLDPDDRVWLLDELPAGVAPQLLRGLPDRERELTAVVLGYPQDSIGRRMSPEYVTTHPGLSVTQTLARIHAGLEHAETIYTVPVLDDGRRVVGIVSLRNLMSASGDTLIDELMKSPHTVKATADVEDAARVCADLGLLALPIVDSESRLVGILTIDDAVRILENEETEDAARQGGVEPLRRPYLSTPIRSLVRSRVLWLLVLAVGATLTVQVLEVFEDTLNAVTVLALFVPLLIGTGGNTGNQAATTVTRALALGDVRSRDILRVLGREMRVGFFLGLMLGTLGFAVATPVYDLGIGVTIGLTLVAVCTVAATIGGIMPLAAHAIRVDPAVFSNPFISTFVDATGLIIYFLIAMAILQI
ncbi:magnesium transporter [Paramicrobacterium chengjingii]|uniref:Magnesium transporter MgtE n=1 Tax=Paramicrobacterium chengjingii TaxID=2769067 RepID=A0ABX6YJ17_9MICO|nr:magnesium transporter [Microbacterium chengjingii]QPZ38401.1 magnesium transporter [Microbacterium chengjingii]